MLFIHNIIRFMSIWIYLVLMDKLMNINRKPKTNAIFLKEAWH